MRLQFPRFPLSAGLTLATYLISTKNSVACGANCLKKANGTDLNLVEAAKSLFPATINYSTYIPPKTGHGLTAHLSAPETHAVIQKWIADLE